jgi:acyl-coenzyme A thioesterase PaaI-like protein
MTLAEPAAATGARIASLGFDTPVERTEVHKHDPGEVLITDSAAVGPDSFLCAASLPRLHPTYAPAGAGHHDLLLLIEVVRQATIVVGHRHLGVPRDRQFLLREVELAVLDLDACRRSPDRARAIVDVRVSGVRRLDGVVAGFELTGRLSIDGATAAAAAGGCLCLAPEDYRVVRGQPSLPSSRELEGRALRRRAAPAEVGQTEVVVTPIEGSNDGDACTEVIVDPAHSTFFDHPLDHVPAMLLVQAARQVAHAAVPGGAGAVTVGARARFVSFAELHPSVRCDARLVGAGAPASPPASVEVTLDQGGAVIAELSFDLCWANG